MLTFVNIFMAQLSCDSLKQVYQSGESCCKNPDALKYYHLNEHQTVNHFLT